MLNWKNCILVMTLSLMSFKLFASSEELQIKKDSSGLPYDLTVLYPSEPKDKLPVILMGAGYLVPQSAYSDMLHRLAERGFLVLAPYVYKPDSIPFGKPPAGEEAERISSVLHWAYAHLESYVARSIDFDQLSLVNHSRGSKVAWLIVKEGLFSVRSLVAIDPVDGDQDGSEMVIGKGYDLEIPSLIIGLEMSTKRKNFLISACAPKERNYPHFYDVAGNRTWMVSFSDFGHMDFLDESNSCGLSCSFCTGNSSAQERSKLRGFLVESIEMFVESSHNEDFTSMQSMPRVIEQAGLKYSMKKK